MVQIYSTFVSMTANVLTILSSAVPLATFFPFLLLQLTHHHQFKVHVDLETPRELDSESLETAMESRNTVRTA
jgi:hypothetical protein